MYPEMVRFGETWVEHHQNLLQYPILKPQIVLLICCVALGKLLNLSSLICWIGIMIVWTLLGV